MLQVCQRACPHPLELLLPAEDPAVVSELMGRLTNTRGLINGRGWIKEHQKAFSALRLSWTMTPPCPASAASAWLPTLTDLQKSTLALHQHRVLLSHPGSITASGQIQATASGQAQEVQVTASGQIHMPKLMIDVHPSISRLSTSTFDEQLGVLSPCILPGQALWLHLQDQQPRPMLGKESMLFQGWPISQVRLDPWITNKFLQDLAGNGVALPVLLALLTSAFMAMTWTEEENITELLSSSSRDVQDALELLNLLSAG